MYSVERCTVLYVYSTCACADKYLCSRQLRGSIETATPLLRYKDCHHPVEPLPPYYPLGLQVVAVSEAPSVGTADAVQQQPWCLATTRARPLRRALGI